MDTPLVDPVASMEEAHGNGAAGVGVQLRAVQASVSIALPSGGKRKTILDRVSCSFEPGTLTALMGPSGAGKTTLLNALRTGSCSAGSILANGAPYTRLARRMIVTVPQDDILLPGLSPLEMLHYAAQLKLPASVGKGGRLARAVAVLRQLRLSDVDMSTRIGSVDARGLSGGQRKRVSIGLELLTNPPCLLLDEPTSGLDAKMAADVVAILKDLASEGRTVICTVHQPSMRIFAQFDSLVLVKSGRVCYAGPTSLALSHFGSLGLSPPPGENPAEYFLAIVQDEALGAVGGGSGAEATAAGLGVDLIQAWDDASAAAAESAADSSAAASTPGSLERAAASFQSRLLPLDGDCGYAVGGFAQTWVLLRRRLYDSVKDASKLRRTLSLKLTLGLLVGCIWQGSGRDPSFKAIFPTSGALFLVVNNCVMDTLFETVLQFPLHRALLAREYANGTYSLGAYYCALQLSNLLLGSLSAALLAAPVYALVGLSATWAQCGLFIAVLTLMSLIGCSLGVVVGATSSDIDSARSAIVPTLVPLLIFSGYLIPLGKIQPWLRWAYYASFFQYSLGALEINELQHRTYVLDCPAEFAAEAAYALIHERYPLVPLPPLPTNFSCSGQDYLKEQGLYPVRYGGLHGYVLILAGYLAFFLVLAYWVLSRRVRSLVRT